ncbi:GspH/FimT family pseudopilin [Pseudomonas sp. CGJS7]|uniref:GspH/FimT family pseudopilin n=1 Tax=Pseudomonas sp. CGJS7 TaxID=3109348 RepID=UPI0030083ECD
MASRRSAGFTLIELMVTIVIAAILIGLALPSFSAAMRANRVSSATNLVLATLNFSRSEALRSKSSSHVCSKDATGKDCGGDWSNGMLVWTDENNNGGFDKDTEIKRVVDLPKDVKFTVVKEDGKVPDLVFDERGRTQARKAFQISLESKTCKAKEENKRAIVVSGVGRVSVKKETCA